MGEHAVKEEARLYARRYMIVLSVREQVRGRGDQNARYVRVKGEFM
ncbi:MAG: hypothetical protein ACE5IH_10830 [Thermodesulfobacteriota bacterium]